MQRRLSELSRQVLQAEEDERNRIDGELTEMITQTLTL